MKRTFDRRGWMDLGLGFVVGLVTVGIAVAGLNALMGWHRVGVWERTLERRHVEDLEALMLRQIDLSREGIKDEDPLPLAQKLAFTVTPTLYEHYLEYVIFLLEHNQIDRFNQLRAETQYLRLDLSGVSLEGLNLQGADLQGAILEDANFKGAALEGASFFRARLNGADFSGAQIDRTNFSQAKMLNTTLYHVSGTAPDFSQAILINASMTGITGLRDARFDYAELAQCNMEGSTFPGAVFDHADFTLASAVNVDFSEVAGMNDVVFTGANLAGTRWNPANTERPWLVGSQGLGGRTLRELKARGGILHPEELLELIDREILRGFRAQVDEDPEITEDQREAVFFDLLRQYWMR
ncbi:MAG: pentapeptide repeat-containing protein [Acidobacteria bacterium]|nr:pentapeptide repeat-containing protein [Acidobacteriota bacterium]